ncbi:hypothetical protein HYN59_16425 [Flavobacterium album]|uniref:Uncharacterized protein n=1 Tax=Flavobacterium album TaxID=2175091 RepID=A0A2S1R1Y1_9FLAO|nr:hypothetical protein [Flavobacterium album]AWH86596.1 hypothetical protein HYN59_16425 [Flavobacterium album]
MKPISAWTATSQDRLEGGKIIFERKLNDYRLTTILADYCMWFVAEWPNGGRVAFRAAYAANDVLNLDNITEDDTEVEFLLSGTTGKISVTLSFPDDEKNIFRYITTLTPAFDLLMPYWPRDIMPMFSKTGRVQNTKGTVHAGQVGSRSGNLFFSLENPETGSVFYFQNLTALNKYCNETETSAGDLVGGSWPEIGMKLPATSVDKPLKEGEDYIISDAFILLTDEIPQDNYQMAQHYLNHLADIYVYLPRPDTEYHDWPDFLHKGLNDLQNHKGCWQFADGRSYLNAYVSDYKTPPESMVQLAVLLPLMDFDRWSGEDHSPVIETLKNGLENFYDKQLGTLVRWLPAKEKDLDWSEEQKQPEVMDSWYLHHPLLNLSRMALDGDEIAKKLLMDSVDYVIKVAQHFNYEWPVFYKMATLEVLKQETEEGKGGEKDVPGAYAHLMIQVWQLTGSKKYFDEAVKAAKKLDGLGFDVFYQANNTAFSAGALLRLYKETKDELFLNLSYVCIAAVMKNVQLWEADYGNAKHYQTFFAIYPLKDAPYTAAYEEQEVFAAIHTYLKEADGVEEILPSVRLLLAECIKYVIHRVSYYYPPRLPREVLAEREDVKTGEIDPNLWIALEDLQDGWNRSGQVGQEVYGAGIAFGIVPRQYHKVDKGGFMIFNEYPATQFHKSGDAVTFSTRGDSRFTYRMVIAPLADGQKVPSVTVSVNQNGRYEETGPVGRENDIVEFCIPGDSKVKIEW